MISLLLLAAMHRSPDHALVAKIVDVKWRAKSTAVASRIEIRDRIGRLVASRDYSIYSGLAVCSSGWTHDSRFFVFNAEEPDGHQPWHFPAFFYDRGNRRFYCLEEALAAAGHSSIRATTSADFKLIAPSTVVIQGRYDGPATIGIRAKKLQTGDAAERELTIDLRWLEKHLTSKAVSSDKKDKIERS